MVVATAVREFVVVVVFPPEFVLAQFRHREFVVLVVPGSSPQIRRQQASKTASLYHQTSQHKGQQTEKTASFWTRTKMKVSLGVGKRQRQEPSNTGVVDEVHNFKAEEADAREMGMKGLPLGCGAAGRRAGFSCRRLAA